MPSPISTDAFFRAIVDSSTDAILSKDLNGIITSWNRGAERMFGYKAAEIVGRPVSVLFPPERSDEEPSILGRISRGEVIEHYETVRRRKDGTDINISLTVSPIVNADGVIVGASKIARDVTDQKRAEIAERQFAAIVEGSDDAIIGKNLSGIVTSWNRGAEMVFGYTAQEMIGKSILTLLPEDRVQEEGQIIARLQRGEKVDHFLTERVRKDGTRIYVSLTISPIRDNDGKIVGASKIARDVTVEREARARLADYARTLEERVRERTQDLQDTIAELEAFSYSLSHDMRAPVRTILSLSEILLEDFDSKTPEAGDHLKVIISSTARLDRLILDVLTFIRLSRSELVFKPVDLNRLMHEIVKERKDLHETNAIIQIAPDLGAVIAHEISLTQCLTNLLSNAVKFVARGKVANVRLETENRGDTIRIKVVDSGIGIDAGEKAKLFNIFQRTKGSGGYAGTGVGLAIVKKAVDRMHGRVGVDSSLGLGSTFWIELPKAEL